MIAVTFSAELFSLDNKYIDTCTASISENEGFIELQNDFIPFFKRGTPVKVSCLLSDVCFVVICGDVNISTKTLLSIECTDEIAYFKLCEVFKQNISKKLFAKGYKTKTGSLLFAKSEDVDLSLYYIDKDTVKFRAMENVSGIYRLKFSFDKPVYLRSLVVEIKKAIVLDRFVSAYICEIVNPNSGQIKSISRYLESLKNRFE